jgi:hypothetical protein
VFSNEPHDHPGLVSPKQAWDSYSLRARAKSTQRWNRDPGFLASAIDSVGSRHDFLEYFSAERISNGRALKSSSPWSRTARGAEVQPTAA